MRSFRAILCLLLCLVMLLPAAGCSSGGGFRIIDEYNENGDYCLGFRKGDHIQEYLSAALEVLADNNTLKAASINWFGDDLIATHGDSHALDEMPEAMEPRTITVGVDVSNMPMSFMTADGTGYQGFDVDVISYACGLLGWNMVFRPIEIGNAGVELNSSNIDVAMAVPGTDLSDELDYSPAYLESQFVLVTRSGSHIRRRGSMKGKTLGVALSDVDVLQQNQKFVDSLGAITYQTNTDGLFQALIKGEVDGILVTSVVASYYMNRRAAG